MKYIRYARLLILMMVRNIRWVTILLFRGEQRPWSILNFELNLCARQAGLDLTENSIHKQLILDRVREHAATDIMVSFIEPDDVILELGANIGYYVIMETKILSDKGYIYAVEPSPDNVALLKANIELNNAKHIEIFNMAMSDQQGVAKLYMGPACNLHSLVDRSDQTERDFMEVQTDSVDHFLEDKKPITFLRMDVEGYETVILNGMHKTLESPVLKKLFIEIHPMVIEPDVMRAFLEQIENAGFEIEAAISRDNWQRTVLGQCKTEHMTIAELAQDPRVLNQVHAFEIFFRRK